MLPERLYLPVKTTERTSPRAPDRQAIPKKDDNKNFKKVFCICFENRHLLPNFNLNVNTPAGYNREGNMKVKNILRNKTKNI